MAIAYFDCFAGAGGDMIVASLIDAGADFTLLEGELAKLGAAGYGLSVNSVQRGGLVGAKFEVRVDEPGQGPGQPARNLPAILEMIARAGLAGRAADRASRIFRRLAAVEAKVHGVGADQVHFHEVGAIDSIMDVVGACVALELLDVDSVYCSAIPVGSGTVRTAHGELPVPSPATARLLVNALVAATDVDGEATTPTAAAVLTELAEGFGGMPAMRVSAVGCGAGSRQDTALPNLLRVFVGEADPAGQADAVVEVSANIDDCTGEVLGAAIDRLLEAGCLDVWATPIYMKKSRPAWMLSALCDQADADRAEEIILSETTTFGVRRHPAGRTKLTREHKAVETPFGPIRMKIGRRGNRELSASPEFSDCQAAARAHNVPVRQVMASAQQAYSSGPPARHVGPGDLQRDRQ